MRKVRRRKLFVALTAVLVLGVVMVATPAGATMNWTNIWNTHLKPKADKRYVNESELLWAVIDGNTGNLDRGNGVTYTNKSDTGDYQVRFNKNVRNCVYVATIGLRAPWESSFPARSAWPARTQASTASGSTRTTPRAPRRIVRSTCSSTATRRRPRRWSRRGAAAAAAELPAATTASSAQQISAR